MVIFSVDDYSVWEIYPVWMFSVFYTIAILLILFPRSSRVWPLSTFSFLSKYGRWNGVVTLVFVSLIAIPHFLMTNISLEKQKKALLLKNFTITNATFDGQQSDKKVGLATYPEPNLSFDGKSYEVTGSLHGSMTLLPEIRNQLQTGETYRLSIFEGVLLKIETLN